MRAARGQATRKRRGPRAGAPDRARVPRGGLCDDARGLPRAALPGGAHAPDRGREGHPGRELRLRRNGPRRGRGRGRRRRAAGGLRGQGRDGQDRDGQPRRGVPSLLPARAGDRPRRRGDAVRLGLAGQPDPGGRGAVRAVRARADPDGLGRGAGRGGGARGARGRRRERHARGAGEPGGRGRAQRDRRPARDDASRQGDRRRRALRLVARGRDRQLHRGRLAAVDRRRRRGRPARVHRRARGLGRGGGRPDRLLRLGGPPCRPSGRHRGERQPGDDRGGGGRARAALRHRAARR